MSEKRDKPRYPSMNVNQWWTLRDRFKTSIPRSGVTPTYLSTVFSVAGQPPMTEKSARDNVLAPLKLMGLVDKDGMPTELAEDWRTDSEYASVCQKIRDDVYPQELLDALPPPEPNLESAKNWFMRSAKVGESAARKMAATYSLLCEADPSRREVKSPRPAQRRSNTPRTNAALAKEPHHKSGADNGHVLRENLAHPTLAPSVANGEKSIKVDPSVHIDIQIHISPESSDKQIETIFANMAKHLYGEKQSDA